MTKSSFVLTIALCLLFQLHHAAAQGAVQGAAKDSLIHTACAATSTPPLCSSALSSIANSPYLNPTNIAITAVQVATKISIATFDIINMSLTTDLQIISDPGVKQSLSVCATEYKTVIDNMNSATGALTQNFNPQQVPGLLNAALGSASKCENSGIKNTNKVVQIVSKSVDCTKLIKNALDIYQVFANFIVNPDHDPRKGGVSLGPLGGGGAGGGGLLKGGAGGGGLLKGGAGGGGLLGGGGAAAAGGGAAAGGQISNRKLLSSF